MDTPKFNRALTFEQAKALYLHRFTMDHVPAWAREQRDCGGYYAPQYSSDLEWYNATRFQGEPGWLGAEGYCYSAGQTWPLGKRLDAPYQKG